jgi:hypothetical protein
VTIPILGHSEGRPLPRRPSGILGPLTHVAILCRSGERPPQLLSCHRR